MTSDTGDHDTGATPDNDHDHEDTAVITIGETIGKQSTAITKTTATPRIGI